MIRPASFFKCLSDETRLRCMLLLHKVGELCVCELTHALDLSQPKISRHLAQLRQCGLLLDTRKGQWVYYRLNPELENWAIVILDSAASAMDSDDDYRQDCSRLQLMEDRPGGGKCCE